MAANPPLVQQASGNYNSGSYEDERARGIRQEGNGRQRLKKLRPVHKLIIKLHLLGKKQVEIAKQLNRDQAYISLILNDPLAQAEIERTNKDLDDEFRALYSDAIDAIRKGLNHENPDVRLRAADKYLKAHGKYQPEKEVSSDTAEDVIQRILNLHLHLHQQQQAGDSPRVINSTPELSHEQNE